MWVQLCVNCDTVFARATKTRHSLQQHQYVGNLTRLDRHQPFNTKADQLRLTPRGRHTKCSVLHSSQNKDHHKSVSMKYVCLRLRLRVSVCVCLCLCLCLCLCPPTSHSE